MSVVKRLTNVVGGPQGTTLSSKRATHRAVVRVRVTYFMAGASVSKLA